jgi:hypothetical protein
MNMSTQPELVAPISVDLRAPDLSFDIVKGIEHINYQDYPLVDPTLTVTPGDWMTLSSSGLVVPATGNAVPNVFPVIVGNNQFDSIATGNLTVGIAGGFVYQTTKYVAGSYTVGQNLCVKNLGGGERVPSAAGANDSIVARVLAIDTVKNVMTILVLNR